MRDRHLKYLLVLPAVVVVFATAIWPLIQSLILSFRTWRLSRSNVPGPFIGFENYEWALFEEPAFWNATWVTTLYTVLTVGLTVLIALGIALLLAPGGRLRLTVRTLLILPFAMSPALVGVSFRFMFNPEFGLFDAFFGLLLPPLADVAWLSNPTLAFAVCVMADVWGWIPFITLVLIGGIAALPKETIEAAYVDGASAWQAFKDVTLPQLMPVLGNRDHPEVDLLHQDLRSDLHAHQWRPRHGDADARALRLFQRLQILRHGLRRLDRLDHGPADDFSDIPLYSLRL